MKKVYFQPIVRIGGGVHLHSQLFESLDEARKAIALNSAYVWIAYKEVVCETDR